MQNIEYRVVAAKVLENRTHKAHEQTFKSAAAALRARDYLISKGYIAAVKPTIGVNLTAVI